MKRDNIIRAGDRVDIIVPERVIRVGYPKCVNDYLPEAEALLETILANGFSKKDKKRIIWEMARGLLAKNKFGGVKRSVHTEPLDLSYVNGRLENWGVIEVYTRMTGTYYRGYAPRRDYSYYGWDEGEPARLDDACPVRIAVIGNFHIEVKNLKKRVD